MLCAILFLSNQQKERAAAIRKEFIETEMTYTENLNLLTDVSAPYQLFVSVLQFSNSHNSNKVYIKPLREASLQGQVRNRKKSKIGKVCTNYYQ